MPNRLWIAAVVAAMPLLAMSRLSMPVARDAGCVLAMHGARSAQRSFMSMMRSRSDRDHARLVKYNIGHAKPGDVELITDDDVCERAANAYSSAVGDVAPDRHVTVLRVRDRYVVRDPAFRRNKHRSSVTFDSTFSEPLAVVVE